MSFCFDCFKLLESEVNQDVEEIAAQERNRQLVGVNRPEADVPGIIN